MVPISYKAKVPGSMMFFGEHAVLHQKQAIVFAIDKYISVHLTIRSDRQVVIRSALGTYQQDLSLLSIVKPFQFVLASILCFKESIATGFELDITSEFSEDLGLGSSAAVTVATVAVFSKWLGNNHLSDDILASSVENSEAFRIFNIAKSIIQAVQGIGSGADVAASVYGGIILYQTRSPCIVKHCVVDLPITVIYSGSKTPTTEVIGVVNALIQKFPDIYSSIFDAIQLCVNAAFSYIEKEAWEPLGALMNIQQGLMNALGVGTALLDQLLGCLKADSGIYGAKISGSGLGDCIIGLGQKQIAIDNQISNLSTVLCAQTGVKELKLAVSKLGVAYE